jgi:hypothetical protein
MCKGLLRLNALNAAADSVLRVGLVLAAQGVSHGVTNSRIALQSLGKVSNQLREPAVQLQPEHDGHTAAHSWVTQPSKAGQ